MNKEPSNRGEVVAFVRCFRHWKTGRMIYAKPGSAFPIRRGK